MPEYSSFRNQAEAKAPWELDADARRGLSQSVNNNQPQMALYYVVEIVKELDAIVNKLSAEIADLKKQVEPPKSTPAKTVAKKVETLTEA